MLKLKENVAAFYQEGVFDRDKQLCKISEFASCENIYAFALDCYS